MTYLDNIFYLIPEIFLSLSIVFLLGYGVIYTKLGGDTSAIGATKGGKLVGELKNITYLSILALFITI
tara:strand:+ start:988 stop:1191 length:204 start_codon:yes stop_codon:yes gene_type:complete